MGIAFVVLVLTAAWGLMPDEFSQAEELRLEMDGAVSEVASDAVQKENPTLVVRGMRDANSDKGKAVLNPFSPDHSSGTVQKDAVSADYSEAGKKASAGKANMSQQVREKAVDGVSAADERKVRLIGILLGDKSVAVIDVNNKQVSLTIGEEQAGVQLLSVDSDSALVKTSAGQQRLFL